MTDDGAVVERQFPASEAPELGAVVVIDGVKATRIVSRPGAVRGDNWKPYVSDRLPRGLAGTKHTPSGKPIIETRQQEREVCARHGYERE